MRQLHISTFAAISLTCGILCAQSSPKAQGITAKPTPVSESTRNALLTAREAVWRAQFIADPSLIPPEAIGIVEWTDDWKHRDEIISGAKEAAANGLTIKRLEFPRTEIQLYGDTAILYSTYIYEAEFNGQSAGVETGRSTEVFVRRNGKWLNSGWHVDSGLHLTPRENLRKTLLDLRESIWRAYFNNDSRVLQQTLRPDFIRLDEEVAGFKKRDDLLYQARKLAEGGVKLLNLDFPHTELRVFEQTAILFSDFRLELESNGQRLAPVTGHTTETFILRDGKWYGASWHYSTPARVGQ